jgi:ADP-ribose pyrophosphatase YjhB (NUDIX family)/ribosomal protein S27AE
MHETQVDYRFCPVCGGTLEPRLLKQGDPERLVCGTCGFVFYLDPKVAVGTIIRIDQNPSNAHNPGAQERVVLVRRAIEPGYGRWVFPGGYVDRGEPLEIAAIREAREESGLDVRLDGLVNLYSYAGRAPVIIVYAATAVGGALCADDECLEAKLFTRDEIPWDDLAFRSTRDALKDYFIAGFKPSAMR